MLTVAIIGRPNVGKSTLFNRLVGRRAAIVHDTPGVTRDRQDAVGRIADLEMRLVDTAGLEEAGPDKLEGRMRLQTDLAVSQADVALMLIDSRAGITPLDAYFGDLLRRGPIPVILVANKCEGGAGAAGLYESYSLGLGDPVPVSAEHGEGMGLLFEALLPHADRVEAEEAKAAADAAWQERSAKDNTAQTATLVLDPDDTLTQGDPDPDGEAEDPGAGTDEGLEDSDPRGEKPLRLAVVGRPNTGKSTLINRLVGQDRLLTGPEAGVTRDAIEVDWLWQDRKIRLVDTAGLRRKARIAETLEKLSVADTLDAIRLAEVCVLLVEADGILDKQDLAIARHVIEEGRALVIGVNKWDICTDRKGAVARLQDKIETSLPQVRGIPAVTLSALTGQGTDDLLEAVTEIHGIWNRRVPTSKLNRWLEDMTSRHPPPIGKHGRRLKIRYLTQIKSRPPTFTVFMSRPEDLPEDYKRYLVGGLRRDFDMVGVPIRLWMRKPKNPYENHK